MIAPTQAEADLADYCTRNPRRFRRDQQRAVRIAFATGAVLGALSVPVLLLAASLAGAL
jgi:hypothetical protein